ncbi:Fungal transcriptional regulatory protein [Cordyceps javanica]|uniref:Fungal transcriptional regulatory protein n=1 Tax=Cordyceps javanica TaxID=43265 RepID=A0A545V0W7_9HYPO|nr:Fungal transcriptional regulatory protein [Cordyceps javanica]TQW02516.1 Fungal transcriptional regulatory protein [Cordyceps javanica]
MSGHPNNNSSNINASQGSGGYPAAAAWSFSAAPGYNASAAVGTGLSNTSPTTGSGRPLLAGLGSANTFSTHGSARYGARAGHPYESSLVRRRQMSAPGSASSRDRRVHSQTHGGDPERKRVVVACLRCRKRKIRCSGDDGTGGACTNCRNANEPQCLFMRVQAGSLAEMRKKEQDKRLAAATTATSFSYDMDACRQYQSRSAASLGSGMSAASQAHSHSYGASPGAAFGGPNSVLYNWTPGTAGVYGDNNSHGSGSGTSNGGAGMAYNMSYHGMPYHGMPSPDTSYMGDNDLMDRQTTPSMADAGAFALQNMSQGLSGGGHGNPYHNHGPVATTSTPRSLPGPPTVLGSSRGVPTSSVFTASRAPQQYPSPATTPITSGVSPVWTGYHEQPPQQQSLQHQSPYGSASMSTSMSSQSLERLPDPYSATPPPPLPPLTAESGSGSRAGGDNEVPNSGGGGATGDDGGKDNASHQHQSHQEQQFVYEYGDDGRGQSQGSSEEHAGGGGGSDMVHHSHRGTPGSY